MSADEKHILIARGYSRAATTEGLYREVLLTTSAPRVIIQTGISQALTNDTSEMTNNANDIRMGLRTALHYCTLAQNDMYQSHQGHLKGALPPWLGIL